MHHLWVVRASVIMAVDGTGMPLPVEIARSCLIKGSKNEVLAKIFGRKEELYHGGNIHFCKLEQRGGETGKEECPFRRSAHY